MEGNIFQQEVFIDVPHNDFDLGFNNRLTCAIGSLIPTAWYLCMPGDRFDIRTTINVQTVPLMSPAYANLRVYNATFAVPIRLLWNEFETFISPENPNATPVVHPYVDLKSPVAPGDIGDYLGIPVNVTPASGKGHVSALPGRAYAKIFNEWFRDENVQPVGIATTQGSGVDAITDYRAAPAQVLWRKDYFASALPSPQFGAPAVASLNSGGTGTEVEEIRRANALQRWLERASAVGHRYIEAIFGHFGVRSSDARLQRPELIGYNSAPLRIDTVLQTSQTSNEDTPTGTRYGTMNSSCQFMLDDGSFYCEEHMIIMNLMFIRPEADYVQGLAKEWKLFDRMDWPWPEFAKLGDEEIKNHEIYWQGQTADDAGFGYSQRYAWTKYHKNEVHGLFLSSLNHWTMPRKFSALPGLNLNFLQVSKNADDNIFAFAAQTADHYLVNVDHVVNANRPLPAFGMPTL